ncbi:MAG: hypothetical protein JNL98_09345 [Bryobacterales bacterium]|nr:hypothetical protein [Bryobacterales bacterium]
MEQLVYDTMLEQRYAALDPLKMMNIYHSLTVSFLSTMNGEEVMRTVHPVKLRTYFMVPINTESPKYEEYKARKDLWFDTIKAGLKKTRGSQYDKSERGMLQMAYSGKGFPEEYELALEFAAGTGQCGAFPEIAGIQAHCDTHFGIDCSGFVNAYFLRKHRQPHSEAKSIASRERAGIPRKSIQDVQMDDCLLWTTEDGALLENPGHIAVVHGCLAAANQLWLVQSAGDLGPCCLLYIVKKTKQTSSGMAFQVQRANGDKDAWVRIVGP